MNNFIVSGKGFLKTVKHNKENNQLIFEWSRNVRDAYKYKTGKVAGDLIEKHQLDAFVWNPYKEEPIVGKFGICQRNYFNNSGMDDTFVEHKILEWIPERIVMEKKTDVNFISSKGIDSRTYYDTYEDAVVACRVKNMEILNELIDKMYKLDDTINKKKDIEE